MVDDGGSPDADRGVGEMSSKFGSSAHYYCPVEIKEKRNQKDARTYVNNVLVPGHFFVSSF